MALRVKVSARAASQVRKAAEWWAENRLAASGAIREDLELALALLILEPGVGTKVETPRGEVVRRLCLPRARFGFRSCNSLAVWKPNSSLTAE